MNPRALPRPGPLWGPLPQRPEPADPAEAAPPWAQAWWTRLRAAARPQAVAREARQTAAALGVGAAPGKRPQAPPSPRQLARLRQALRQHGLAPRLQARALGLAAAQAARVLGTAPYPTQLLAAAALLDGRLVEMATGEGKTLATALAAAAAALAGLPVHVVTANAYLAARDADALAPLYAALGLEVAHLSPDLDAAGRRSAYAADVLYATAHELAFDHLRDQLSLGPLAEPTALAGAQLAGAHPADAPLPQPLQRGLCLALLDEADSILLDEAEMPLVLSQPVAAPEGNAPGPAQQSTQQRAWWYQALALARQLDRATHWQPPAGARQMVLNPAGLTRLGELAPPLGGPWTRPAWRQEMVETAGVALHLLQRDRDYLVRAGELELLDEVSGRGAPGRVWSAGLQTVVALKEGLKPAEPTETVARTSCQRFFQRYWRLGGLSGTLWEARGELARVYGLRVLRVPLHQPSRRQHWPTQVFADAPARQAAVLQRAASLAAAGRPILIGTDSVADSEALAAVLAAAGLAHRVLNARHDADEAATVAAAGRAGAITVATRMAGRGTDIALDAAARAAGGLHVINCQRNPSPRQDRQLEGRAGRHGDPGSTERLLCRALSADPVRGLPPTLPACTTLVPQGPADPVWPAAWRAWAIGRHRLWQWREEQTRRARRRQLQAQDQRWAQRMAFAGPVAG